MGSVYTVAQANTYIKNMFTQDFLLNNISVKGEISNCKYHSSGHIYFSIKDKSGVLSCVMFAGRRKGLNFQMREGDRVIVTGNIDVYERDGKYQLYAAQIEREGTGDLYQRFLELKQELEEMGMFAAEYKKPVPRYAGTVGIVTASTGAAVQDIIQIAGRRNPYVKLILYPAKVQGEGAAVTIVNGIRCLDRMKPDVIIVGRGGGSIEDLWAFNEEIVARAIFECETPVISAVGHEVDYTIADFVADLRAPTPSAAAELAVFEYDKFLEYLEYLQDRLNQKINNRLKICKNRLEQAEWRLEKMSPSVLVQSGRRQLQDCLERLQNRMGDKIKSQRHLLAMYSLQLEGQSPLKKLAGGYAFITDREGKPIRDIHQIEISDVVDITLKNGRAKAVIQETETFRTGQNGGNHGSDKKS